MVEGEDFGAKEMLGGYTYCHHNRRCHICHRVDRLRFLMVMATSRLVLFGIECWMSSFNG